MTEVDVDSAPTGGADEARHLIDVARRAALGRGASQQDSEDVAQEAYARLLVAGGRLEASARLPFVVTTARNLAVDGHRAVARDRRHQHRFVEAREGARPDEAVIDRERDAAVGQALQGQPATDRQVLLEHAEGASTADLAGRDGSTPGAIAARLARSRARMRLDYVLALRRTSLPTATCRSVLMAVSAGDLRRQRALDAAGHLDTCSVCADLVPPLAERRSALAGLATAPLLLLGGLGGSLVRAARTTAGQVAAAATALVVASAVAAVAVVAATNGHSTSARPQAPPVLSRPVPTGSTGSTGSTVARVAVPGLRTASGSPVDPGVLGRLTGDRLVATAAPVQSVVAHAGFWLGRGSSRVYVHIDRADRVRVPVRVISRVTLTGRLVSNGAGLAAADGVVDAEGLAQLKRQGVHLVVDAADLHVG